MNIFDIIKSHMQNIGSKTALTDGTNILTYKRLYKSLCCGQQYVKSLNLDKNVPVVLKEVDQLSYVLMFLSLISSGLFVLPVPKDIKDRALSEIIEDTNAVLIDGTINLTNINANEEETFEIPNEEKTGIIHMTSGSTGKSKYCIRTLKALTREGYNYKEAYSLCPLDKVMSTCPISHSYALGAALMSSLFAGCSLYLINKFNPREAVKKICYYEISYLIMVSDTARLLCLANEKLNIKDFKLRVGLVGAGSINEELYNTFYRRFGVWLLSNYGSTETGAVITRTESLPYNSVGKPMKGVLVKIKSEDGKVLDYNCEGQLFIKSESMLIGYWNNELECDCEGYFPMGDIVYCDNNGYLYVMRRIKPIIKIGGNSFNASSVEKVILEYPNVNDCIVYEVKGKNGESALMAMIAGERVVVEELRKHCCANLASYMIPSEIIIKKEFERNEMGKIKLGIIEE